MLLTNLKGNVLQLEGRIRNQILEELLIFSQESQEKFMFLRLSNLLVWKVLIKAWNNGFQQYYFNNTPSTTLSAILF